MVDLRDFAEFPYEEIDFPVNRITINKAFCLQSQASHKQLNPTFAEAVKIVFIEDSLENCVQILDYYVEHLEEKFCNLKKIGLTDYGDNYNEDTTRF